MSDTFRVCQQHLIQASVEGPCGVCAQAKLVEALEEIANLTWSAQCLRLTPPTTKVHEIATTALWVARGGTP